MSYARFGPDSDVYVYWGMIADGTDGWVCCGCHLEQNGYETPSHLEMIGHLVDHKMAGHKVPDGVDAAIRSDRLEPHD